MYSASQPLVLIEAFKARMFWFIFKFLVYNGKRQKIVYYISFLTPYVRQIKEQPISNIFALVLDIHNKYGGQWILPKNSLRDSTDVHVRIC